MSDPLKDEINPEISKFVLYGIGRAANNKTLNPEHKHELEITPIEQLSMLDGQLISLPFDSEAEGLRPDGSTYSSKVKLNTALTATWLPFGSNRKDPPDVRRGERVFIYRYGDTDQYYWKETGWDDHLRRLETVHYRFSATADPDANMDDPENYYHLMVSTHEKLITLKTSSVNGEACQYALQFNTGTGLFVLTDDQGNFFQLESLAKIMSMQNGDGTLWQLDKEKIYGYARDQMHVLAEKKIHFQTKDFLLECETGQINASTSFGIKTPSLKVESDTNLFQTPNSTFTGNVSIGQSLTAAASGSGSATFQGPVSFVQNAVFQNAVNFQVHVTANGITSSAPITGPRSSI